MPLLALAKSSAEAVNEFTIEQIVSSAGDGVLRDHSVCSEELRTYFSQIPSEKLMLYVNQCLSSKLEKGGMVLQDLINEFGRRLDYNVTNGLYQGRVNAVGFDGIWISPEGSTLIIEVKTTDAYRVSLDVIAKYRQRLVADGVVKGEPSILIIVGRQDTGELEAQIRGSKHAWDIRLISAEALIKLAVLKENTDHSETVRKMRAVLTPVEYTRLDSLVDVMFTAATDLVQTAQETSIDHPELAPDTPVLRAASGNDENATRQVRIINAPFEFTDQEALQTKRSEILKSVSTLLSTPMIKKSRALYWDATHDKRIACTISKKYINKGAYPYWYAFHPSWNMFLSESSEAYLVLGCMDLLIAYMIPHRLIVENLSALNMTQTDRGHYWHLHIVQTPTGLHLNLPKGNTTVALDQFALKLVDQA